ncbi:MULTISPECIES: hypothetical protein [Pseudomonas]|uniref:hypothetical protein n=1 Tax=Pseudomonas TaxID=286 RepID=UPI001E41D1EF|nr:MULTISPECIES: hypothetical protein [Pseudomonas]MCD5981504.1 hypothetical protein [Pseudomonas sp. CDFA 610]MCQ9470422.1 hypothetical protein [Pseudomonas alliivorans]
MKELMTALTVRKRDAKQSLTNDNASEVKQIFRLIVRELRPDAPRRRLLERCRKRRNED